MPNLPRSLKAFRDHQPGLESSGTVFGGHAMGDGGARAWDEAAFIEVQARAASSNLDRTTLLATDYLNHFNEVVMLIEMIPDMPEILDDAKAWRPKSYADHFRDSSIADRDIAIEAYAHVPPQYRDPFETTVRQLDSLVTTSIARLEADLAENPPELLRENATALSQVIQRLMEVASGIIHGSEKTMDQNEIDQVIGA